MMRPPLSDDLTVVSYIGYPLHSEAEQAVGTLCLLDSQGRRYDAADIQYLSDFARHIENVLLMQRKTTELTHQNAQLTLNNQRIKTALARHDALLETAAAGIVSIDEKGIIETVNQKLLALFGYEEHELVGQNIKMLMPASLASEHDGYLKNYKKGVKQGNHASGYVIGGGRELVAQHKNGEQIVIHLAVSEVINPDSHQREFIGIITDIREQKRAERKVLSERALLSTLHEGITNFNALLSGNQLWDFLQQSLLELTESDYAFIGEVVNVGNAPALKIHSITDLSWNEESRRMAGELMSGERLIDNPKSLLGRVFAEGETVIVPDMAVAHGKGGQPEGHPELYNYLGIPIVDEDQVIGMFAIANSDQVISEDLANWLEPFTSTCSLLIRFYRMNTENERVMQQLREARDDMEAASKAKSEFLSSMSHELRTPLNSIIGFSQLMLTQTKTPLSDKQVKQTEQIHASGKHLLTLINEILDLAKIEAGKLSLSIEPSNVHSMVDESIGSIMPIAESYGIDVSMSVDERISVLADYTRLKQVLINLLSNAIKYNRENGSVHVSLSIEELYADIAIKDTGIGVDMNKVEELFEPFNRVGAENSAIEGTGVGLALTKKLVEYMNGAINVRSDSGGSTFTVRLPLSEDSIPMVEGSTEHIREDVTSPSQRQNWVVLYVEDNPTNQSLMEDIFEDIDDVELRCVSDPLVGFEKAKLWLPDLIILDINLPHIDGYELLSMIQTVPSLLSTPVIALSANAMPVDVARGIERGFGHYLTKPVDIPALLEILASYQTRFNKGKQ